MFKAVKGFAPKCTSALFWSNTNNTVKCKREHNIMCSPNSRLRELFAAVNVALIYNNLNPEIRSCKSVNAFKRTKHQNAFNYTAATHYAMKMYHDFLFNDIYLLTLFVQVIYFILIWLKYYLDCIMQCIIHLNRTTM